jgi:serine/threonine protein kinase
MPPSNIKHISCDSYANESEENATEYIFSKLKNNKNTGSWYIFTNYSVFSDISYHLPLEIDMLFIGTRGLQIIEIKHWDSDYINNRDNLEIIKKEAVKLNNKVKKIIGKIRQTRCRHSLGHINGKFLLTKDEKQTFKEPSGRKTIGGIEFFGLSEWKEMLELNSSVILDIYDIESLCSILEPQSKPLVTNRIRNFQNFINLELCSSQEQHFCHVYKALRKPGREKVILNLYDLSASTEANSLIAARREFNVIQKLQKSEFIPRIMDSFQEAYNYPGELYFFSYVEPEAPSLRERGKDKNWHIEDKIYAAKNCFDALSEFHDNPDISILHRNITPDTIKIRSNNKPIFTQLQFSRISGATTIAGLVAPEFKGIEQFVAPEVRPSGIAGCTKQSDLYSLCTSLSIIFEGKDDGPAKSALDILSEGLNQDPLKRAELNDIRKKFEHLYEKSDRHEEIDVKYWDEDTVKELHGRYYKIITKLGSGNVGSTFKVMEVHPKDFTKIKSGPYVAKVITNEDIAEQSIEAYSRVRGQSGGNYLAGVLEGRAEWKRNEITSLLKWIEGEPLSEFSSRLPLYLDELREKEREIFLLQWVKNLCEGLGQLHKENLVHGDVSPKNIIVDGEKITLTDFDLSVEAGTKAIGGTRYYCPYNVSQLEPTTPSDDIFSLAASIFHVLFNRLPFEFDGIIYKNKGMNWDGLDYSVYPHLTEFLKKAAHPEKSVRYKSAIDALAEANQFIKKITEVPLGPDSEKDKNKVIEVNEIEVKKPVEPPEGKEKQIILPKPPEAATDDIPDNTMYLQFWKTLLKEINKKSNICKDITPDNNNLMSITSGISNVTFDFDISKNCGTIGLYIGRGNMQENKFIFDELKKQTGRIEKDFDGKLIWDRMDNKKPSRIKYELKNANIKNKEEWGKIIQFMTDGMIRMEKAFKGHIMNVRSRLKS